MDRETMRKTAFAMAPASPPFPPVHIGFSGDLAPPKLPPPWVSHLFGSLGELLARSVRISNRKFKRETSWTPKYPSVREGWRAVVSALGRAA